MSGKVLLGDSFKQKDASGIPIYLQVRPPFYGVYHEAINAVTGQNGAFKIPDVQTGSYFFSLGDNDSKFAYMKRVVCNGKDYTVQPLTVNPGATVADCAITLETDMGTLKGTVFNGDKPAPNLIVVAIPQLRSLREQARYTVTGNTNANGEYQLSGIIPGDYLVFAVPPDDEQSYFAIDFADRNQKDGEPVAIKMREIKNVNLKQGTPQ